MDHFTYRHADLGRESVVPSAVAGVVGTPVSLCPQDVRSPARQRLEETCEDLMTGEEMS